jgi:hypothetical protein
MQRLVPYLLLALLALGTGLGIGLGIAEAPVTQHTAARSIRTGSASTTTVPNATPTVVTSSPAESRPPCESSQLSVQVGRMGVGLGHVGWMMSFTNMSSAACSLFGYPGLQMLDAARGLIPTEVTDGTAYTVPSIPGQVVDLAPGANASFDLGYDDVNPGDQTAICPTSAVVAITAPGNDQAIITPFQITPYGGSSIATRQCGQVTVSPVFTASG